MMEWISVNDRLPDENKEPYQSFLVMVKVDNPMEWSFERPMVCEYKAFKDKTWTAFDGWSYDNIDMEGYVTHWMPLPQPPKD